jgi:hypothetical protein
LGHPEQREQHWTIIDLVDKGGPVRPVSVPDWMESEQQCPRSSTISESTRICLRLTTLSLCRRCCAGALEQEIQDKQKACRGNCRKQIGD